MTKTWVTEGPFSFSLCTEDKQNPDPNPHYWVQIRYDAAVAFGLTSSGISTLLCSMWMNPGEGLPQLVDVVEKMFWLLVSNHSLKVNSLEPPPVPHKSAWERLGEEL
jgi:hypothetical protein